jgi:hypothetical protein
MGFTEPDTAALVLPVTDTDPARTVGDDDDK